MKKKIIKAELLAIRSERYSLYVFRNLENGDLLMCTRLPNWQTPDVVVGDKGYLSTETVQAGEKYYDPNNEKELTYNYTNCYFMDFVRESEQINNEITL